MIRELMIITIIASVIGVVVSEILLVIAMVKKNSRITTGKAGRWIMFFLFVLIFTVTALVAIGPGK